MPNRQWLDEFQSELLRRKLPRREVARLVAELSDHLTDMKESRNASGRTPEAATVNGLPSPPLQENHMSMEANVAEYLGSPADVAESARREYHRRQSLLSRSRLAAFCTFVLLPLPALCLAWGVSFAAAYAFGNVLKKFMPDPSAHTVVTETHAVVGQLLLLGILLLPAAFVAVLFGRLARRTAHRWGWGLAACLLVALGTMSGTFKLTYGDTPGKNQVFFGVGIGKSILHLNHFGQFLIPLATGVLVLRRSSRLTNPPDGGPKSPARETPDEYGMARAA
jgi:hypothetical protein